MLIHAGKGRNVPGLQPACAAMAAVGGCDLSSIQRVKGMQDILPDDRRYWNHVITTATALAAQFGFQPLDIPVLEYTELFERGIGQGSDIFVQKEMYTLDEGEGVRLTLRPEFTAGVVRAYLENGLHNWLPPVKVFLIGPIFRRERPQAGRFRQHSQFNAEIMGETDPAADLEVMLLAMTLYERLGYRGLSFQLNSTGCRQCRPVYIDHLRTYLDQHQARLAPVDQERLLKNPLRVLDSKEPGMDDILAAAPRISDFLCADCADHFAELRHLLERLSQPYSINFRLVRGLDYYEKTVFEVWAEGIGAQAAVCGGGRYDLAPEIGGPSVPSVGFGSGIERIILALKQAGIEPPPLPAPEVMVIHMGGATKPEAAALAFQLRRAGVATRLAFGRTPRSFKSQMREANKAGIRLALILGESELAAGQVAVKPLTGGEQWLASLATVVDSLASGAW